MYVFKYLEKIFNVRKVHYKQFDNEKCIKIIIQILKARFHPLTINKILNKRTKIKT